MTKWAPPALHRHMIDSDIRYYMIIKHLGWEDVFVRLVASKIMQPWEWHRFRRYALDLCAEWKRAA